MLDLGLGDISEFPFIDPPKPTMVREGLKELLELGAIRHGEERQLQNLVSNVDATSPSRQTKDGFHLFRRDEDVASTALQLPQELRVKSEEHGRSIVLTAIGKKLAKIPVEPRLARMLIAASDNAVLPSVIPLVAAMACDDPRRRPIDEKEKADQAHAKFRVLGSDFLGTLKLWQWWEAETKDLSQSKARKLCKATYLSYPKMREWRDLSRQLEGLCKKIGLSGGSGVPPLSDNGKSFSTKRRDAASPEDFSARLHMSLLSGLLGRIGKYDEEERDYRGAHGLRFAIHPGSVLAKALKKGRGRKASDKDNRPVDDSTIRRFDDFPQWIVAGELVDTARLFARDAAVIDVRWIEPVAGPICKHSYHSPEWDPRFGFVRANEQVTLYGLVIVPARRCDYSRINPAVARSVFIRRGLVDGEFPKAPPEVRANQQLLDALRRRAERSRRPDIFDADRLFAHFDKIIPQNVLSADALRKWLRRPDLSAAARADRSAFLLKKADWWPDETAGDRDFPDCLRIAGKTLALTYRHAPDDPENDGVTCTVRASDAAVLKLWRPDWLVPGLLPEKLSWMLGTLPSALRRILTPLNESVEILLPLLKPGSTSLEAAVRAAVQERWAIRIPENAWNWSKLPLHLQMRFRIRDDKTGKTLASSRDLDAVLATALPSHTTQPSHSSQTPQSFQTWAFGTIPEKSVDRNSGWDTVSYPALRDTGDGVVLKLFPDPNQAADAHATAVTRLFVLALAKTTTVPFRRSRIGLDAALYLKDIDYADERIANDLLAGAVRETLVRNRPAVRTREEFDNRLNEDRSAIIRNQAEMTSILVDSAATASKISRLLEDDRVPEETADSISTQLAWLLFRGFPRTVPLATLRHYKRYLKGAQLRLERARLSPSSDQKKEALFAPHWAKYKEAIIQARSSLIPHPSSLSDYRWMLEEYRVSLFAQELHTPESVSPKRLDAKWSEVFAGSL